MKGFVTGGIIVLMMLILLNCSGCVGYYDRDVHPYWEQPRYDYDRSEDRYREEHRGEDRGERSEHDRDSDDRNRADEGYRERGR